MTEREYITTMHLQLKSIQRQANIISTEVGSVDFDQETFKTDVNVMHRFHIEFLQTQTQFLDQLTNQQDKEGI